MSQAPVILLTFDLEEFDLPLEYNIPISDEKQLLMGRKGLEAISPFLNEKDITTTLFTTARFALAFPHEVKQLSLSHEIASHSFYHASFEKKDLLNSKVELEKIISGPVKGFRMPRMKPVDSAWIKAAGYEYDSSVNPTYIPGRYNNWKFPRTLYWEDGLFKLPASVSPNLRIPLFWLAFKNMPYPFFKILALQTLKKDGYLSLYFHPWEFVKLDEYPLPFYLKTGSGSVLLSKLHRLVNDFKQVARFQCISDFIISREESFK